MTRVIVVANQKGGVGKSTVVANLGAALAEAGKNVILIDLDPQGALTSILGLDPHALTRTSYMLITRENATLASVLRSINDRLVLVPAGSDLNGIDAHIGDAPDRPFRLRNILMRSRVPADIILIDTPPVLGTLMLNGLTAAQELLIPVQSQYLAMRGVRGVLEAVAQVHKHLNAELNLLGLVATMYKTGSDHAREVLDELKAVFGEKVFETVIEDDDVIASAPVAQKPVIAYSPNSPAAHSFRRLAQEVLHVQ
jgi:chromosome partitioning protein